MNLDTLSRDIQSEITSTHAISDITSARLQELFLNTARDETREPSYYFTEYQKSLLTMIRNELNEYNNGGEFNMLNDVKPSTEALDRCSKALSVVMHNIIINANYYVPHNLDLYFVYALDKIHRRDEPFLMYIVKANNGVRAHMRMVMLDVLLYIGLITIFIGIFIAIESKFVKFSIRDFKFFN